MRTLPVTEDCRVQAEDYRVQALVGSKSLETIRDHWRQWENHPNANFDFFSTVVESRPSVVNPVAIVLFHKDIPVALAAGRLEKVLSPTSFGYLKVFRSAMLQFTIVYGGLMGAWDEKGSAAFIQYMRRWMKNDRIDAIHLAATHKDHPVYQAALRFVPFFLRDILMKDNLHWSADMTDTTELFKNKINTKHRSQFRNKERKLAQFSGGDIRIKMYQTPGDVATFCADAEKISQATYLRGLGEGFIDNQEMRNRLGLSALNGWMRGHVLYANEKPCAFWLGTLYQEVFYLDYTGFNSDLNHYSPGRILFVKMIEEICSANKLRSIDFGFGDAEYKRRYGDRNWKESDLYLFNRTPTMLVTNLSRKSITLLRVAAEKTLKRFDLLASVKKRWRNSAEKTVHGHAHAEESAE